MLLLIVLGKVAMRINIQDIVYQNITNTTIRYIVVNAIKLDLCAEKVPADYMIKADADITTCIRLYTETVSNGLYLRSYVLRSTIPT